MKTISAEQAEIIDAVVAERDVGGLTAAIFEKDIHVTDCLVALFAEPLEDGVELIFCGGTSLSKGHGVIARMSEDIDIKVQLPAGLSAARQRTAMKAARETVIERLQSLDLAPADRNWITKTDESRQVTLRWQYRAHYRQVNALRPELQIELRQSSPKHPVQIMPIEHLVDRFTGEPVRPLIKVPCQHIAETLAEKVMAWLRRRADELQKSVADQTPDRSIARHLHDVHAITTAQPQLCDQALALFPVIFEEELRQYRRSFPNGLNPVELMTGALQDLTSSKHHHADYELHVAPLLFSDAQPDFADVRAAFRDIATQCLRSTRTAW